MSLRVAEPIACRLERLTCGAGSPGVEGPAPGLYSATYTQPVAASPGRRNRPRLPDVSLPVQLGAGCLRAVGALSLGAPNG